ncbi:MAG: sensor domain-containing diguanylate cyclase, partial [Alkalibacterium sp.]|nr:sensor domain-containing diguanylate cyclase [Alkalibacterium sp.]
TTLNKTDLIAEKDYLIAFQQMVLDISFDFMKIEQENFDKRVNHLLEKMGSFFEVDRTYLFTLNYANHTMTYSHEWCNTGINPEVGTVEEVPFEVFSWWLDQLNENNLAHVEDVKDMPAEAKEEQAQLRRQHVQSLISVPIIVDGKIQAFIGIDSVKSSKKWTKENIELLYVMAKILSNGIAQINADIKINFLAYYDSLTELPNRLLLTKRLNQGIRHASRNNVPISILFINLDGFKAINDTLGRSQGDELLKQVAKRLLEAVSKYGMVSRVGGDEFIIYLNDYEAEENLDKIAAKVIDLFDQSFILNEQEYFVTASVGVSRSERW